MHGRRDSSAASTTSIRKPFPANESGTGSDADLGIRSGHRPGTVRAVAIAEAPNATLVMYPDGNHVCNNIPYKYRPLVADWMLETLRRVG